MGDKIDYWISEMNKQGISNDHIIKMKDRVLESNYEYSLYYDEVNTNNKPALINVNKIKGINTGWITAGRTIYELFFSVTREINTSEDPLHPARIKENMQSLINNGKDYQYKFYIDPERNSRRDGLTKFNYYVDDDIYFSDATHRTVSAIMFNAPKMVGYVTYYRKNIDKYNNYIIHSNTVKKWELFASSELKFINIELDLGEQDRYYVYLKDFRRVGFFSFENPITKATYKNLNDVSIFDTEEKIVNDLIQKLQDINDSLASSKLGVLPLPLRILKKSRLPIKYLLMCIVIYKEGKSYPDINDRSDVIAKKLKNMVQLDVIRKCITI